MKKILTKNDFILIGSLLVLAAFFFGWQLFSNRNITEVYANIILNGEIVRTIDLNIEKEKEFYIEERPAVHFAVKNGLVAFICSDCNDQICVNVGFIGSVGQRAACLPNGLLLIVQGTTQPDVDIIIG